MFGRSLLVTLTAFLATVVAKTQNADVQYAILTVSYEYQLFLLETLIKAGDASQLGKFTPVKTKIHEEIVSGKAQLSSVVKQVGEVMLAIDAASPGFKKAALEYASKNRLNMYGISNITPEASWDFIYYSCKRAATELENDKIATNLATLNDGFETLFTSGTAPDAKAMITKIDAFTADAETISKGFGDMVIMAGDMEIEKHRAKLIKLQNGEKIPDETQAPVVASSAGSAAKDDKTTTDKPVVTAAAGSTSGNSSATATAAPEAPEVAAATKAPATVSATTAPPAPVSGAGALSATFTVAASFIAMVVSYVVL